MVMIGTLYRRYLYKEAALSYMKDFKCIKLRRDPLITN